MDRRSNSAGLIRFFQVPLFLLTRRHRHNFPAVTIPIQGFSFVAFVFYVISAGAALPSLVSTLLLSATPGITAADEKPAYLRRGDEVEARYRSYQNRLASLCEPLDGRTEEIGADLAAKLAAARSPSTLRGYQIVPKFVPDVSAPVGRPRVRSMHYSWPWTEKLISVETEKIILGEREFERVFTTGTASDVYVNLANVCLALFTQKQLVDAHLRYNLFWQAEIAKERPGYDRMTELHDAVLERQALLDALDAPDEDAFNKALAEIPSVADGKTRAALETELKERGRILEKKILSATDPNPLMPFVSVEHMESGLWIVRVLFYTDIEEPDFVRAFKDSVEKIWRVHDAEDEFRVEVSIKTLSAARLYGGSPPRRGESVDVVRHVSLFPTDGAVLTTGAITTHVIGRAVVLGPHDIAPHVLAHEFGHILGFKDLYFRGYKDLGQDGFDVMEIVADPNDIMGSPGVGPVLRRHFEAIIKRSGAGAMRQ